MGSAVVDGILAFRPDIKIRILARKPNEEILKKGYGKKLKN